ncbi:hypothetical protein EDD21DRAFT_387876 [Dissophora ornata]|nr:hypothetical protein EDD21DRAFT_387876 [Dissophora ornata]
MDLPLKEVEAMKLRNALELARLEDQVARNVQVNNLIERNKHQEEKEMERQIRREQRRQERKEMKRAQATAGGESMDIDDGGNDPNGAADEQTKRSERRHHRHHRHRSPRLEKEGDESGEMNKGMGEEGDEETAQQQRKERWLRKEQKMQRRQEEEESIQLPLLIVCVPGNAGQSSDSEASISVMRSVRKVQKLKKSGKSKRHCVATGEETTMVEVKIPHQQELSIISDTKILADLGLNEVCQEKLHAMLPQDMLDSARYTTKTTGDGCGGQEVMVTVRGGFERAFMCSAGLY